MTRAKDPERAETEARLQQAITEYKKRQKKPQKTVNPLSNVSLRTSKFLVKHSRDLSMEGFYVIKPTKT